MVESDGARRPVSLSLNVPAFKVHSSKGPCWSKLVLEWLAICKKLGGIPATKHRLDPAVSR